MKRAQEAGSTNPAAPAVDPAATAAPTSSAPWPPFSFDLPCRSGRGHTLMADPPTPLFDGAQAIFKLPDGYCAASDPRKDGQAVGS